MERYIVDSCVCDIINDFFDICNSFGYFSKVVEVTSDPHRISPFKVVFKLRSIPSYQVLRSLNLRFDKVIIIVHDETNVIIDVYDSGLPF